MTSRPLSHAELVVLGLLQGGPAHAYDLVQRIRDMRVDRWARVAESTVYAVLPRLEERDLVSGEEERGERSASRRRYRLTSRGGTELEALARRGLSEPELLYSDRIVAGIIAMTFDGSELLERGLERIDGEIAALEGGLTEDALSGPGRIILDFYLDVARAHRRALEAMEEEAR